MRSLIQPYFAAIYTSRLVRQCIYKLLEVKHQMQGHPIYYYHQVDDPYSYLLSQKLELLTQKYNINFYPLVVSDPASWATPDLKVFRQYNTKDAYNIAPYYQLDFPNKTTPADPELILLAQQILVHKDNKKYFLPLARKLAQGLLTNNKEKIYELSSEYPSLDTTKTQSMISKNNKDREKKGHYLSGMIYHEPDWYWGLDRLPYLEARLNRSGLLKTDAENEPLAVRKLRNTPRKIHNKGLPELKVYFSLRSPYSYLALVEISKLLDKYPIAWSAKPVLPMVMRGLSVPQQKRTYILRDVKREAERLNIPFGKICDPLGEGVIRGLSLIPYARQQGKLSEYLNSFMEGVFADGIDSGSDRGLKRIVERVMLNWQESQKYLNNTEWKDEVEANRLELEKLGLWGVPSFQFGNFSTWGRDRLWLVEEKIKEAIDSR